MKKECPVKASSAKKRRLWLWIPLALAAGFAALLAALDLIVVLTARPYILTPAQAAARKADCILVLGAGVHEGGRPSAMLQDRLDCGVGLYRAGASGKLLMSGDHGRKEYDEVNAMKAYALKAGVPSYDVFMDHAGFSTYESMCRAKAVFKADSIAIVTQEYHLYRAVYDARALGLDAYGVSATRMVYSVQPLYDVREVFARAKDFLYVLFRIDPTYLGDAIPVSGNGDLTNDKPFN